MSDKYLINSSVMTGIADAIRDKTSNPSTAFTPAQMISEIESIDAGGQDIMPATYFTNSEITSYEGNANYILGYAFQQCENLSIVSFPNCNYIGRDAFKYCSKLSTAYFPKCTYIYNSAFYGCTTLRRLYLNEVDSVPKLVNSSVFGGGTALPAIGSIYVPSSLYSDFLSTYPWSYFSARFISV